MQNLFVASDPAYVWRVYSWGMGSTHNFIPCWYVIDEENNIIDGGYVSGGNTQSGYAIIERKKDAIALIEGYYWGQGNIEKLSRVVSYCCVGWEVACPYDRYEQETQRALFGEGAQIAMQESEGVKSHRGLKLHSPKRVYGKRYELGV